MRAARRCRKLTPEEKRAAYQAPEANAGVGWGEDHQRGASLADLDDFEVQQRRHEQVRRFMVP